MTDDNELGRIVTREDGHVLLIGIDRPKKYNGFTNKMLNELAQAYTEYENGPWRCALIYTTGAHFTAGLDLANLDRAVDLFPKELIDPVDLHAPLRTKPVVAAVRGITFTIGFEIALAADMIIAGSDARIAQLEVKRNLIPTCGGTQRMIERAGWGNAMRYLLTGDEMTAQDAYRMGFVQEVVDPEAVYDRALVIAHKVADQAPLAVKGLIKTGRTAAIDGFEASVADLPVDSAALRDSNDAKEGLQSFIERRKANYTGT
jgi:enoyl-CoA hydratase/carnithine racemase